MSENRDETAPTLPGLELESPHGGRPNALRRAVIATITALDEAGLLEPRHTALAQLALELADSVTAGKGRASAAAMAAAQLRETLLALPEPSAAGVQEKFDQLLEQLTGATP